MLVWVTSATTGSMVTAELMRRSLLAAAMALGSPSATSCFVVEELPLQIVELDEIAIDDAHEADAGADERFGDDGAEGTAAADERAAGGESLLPFFAEGGEADLAVVAVWGVRSWCMMSRQPVPGVKID